MGWMIGGNDNTFNYGSDPDAGSPRPEVFCQEINVDLRRLDATPPIVQSGDESADAPDPFEEEDDNNRFVPINKEKEEENGEIIV